MRRRDATARCPDLVLTDHSPERDVRAFEAVLSAVEQVSATVTPIRPGLCALAVPRRFYGGEAEAAAVVAEHLVAAGVWDCRAGIADGMFTAEQAAKQAAPQESVVVPVGGSRRFLSRLPVAVLDDLEQVSLFRRLGLRTLGDLAALPVRDVATRFGASGAWLHRLARGADARPAVARRPPRELDAQVELLARPGDDRADRLQHPAHGRGVRRRAVPARAGVRRGAHRGQRRARLARLPGVGAPPLVQRGRPRRPALLAAPGRPGPRAGGDRADHPRGGGVAGRPRRGAVGHRAGRADRARRGPAAGDARARAGAHPLAAGRPQPARPPGAHPVGRAGR